jgi:hypothetical protein
MQPTQQPTQKPSRPTGQPSNRPTMQPSCQPTYRPVISYPPSGQPSTEPSHFPSGQPTSEPTRHPTKVQPSSRPTRGPSSQPSTRPTQETITRQPTSYLSTDHAIGTVTLVPANADYCTPVEIQISLTVKKSIKAGEYVVIGTPGITSGPCLAATKGGNINSMVMTATNSSGYPISSLEPWQQFTGRYIEGDYVNNYQASRMRFILTAPMHGGTHYLIRIDRSNALRRTCVHNQTWAVTFGHNLVAGLGASLPTTYIPGGNLTFRDNHPKNCFQYFSNLQFYPPYPQQRMSLNFTFLLPFTLRRGDRVVLHLPGFTNKVNNYPLNMMRPNSTVNPLFLGVGKSRTGLNVTTSTSVYDYSVGPVPLVLTYNTKYLWRGTWHEGTNTSGLLAFNHSYLTLYPLGDETSSQTVWVSMSAYENNLISLFGRVANYPGFTVEIFSKMFKLNQTAVTQTTAIGPGCNDYNGCSGNGRCNYELATCSCFDGFGSAADVARTDVNTFLPDCSALACPAAMASVTMAQVSRQTSGFDYHRIVECSNNGATAKRASASASPGTKGARASAALAPGRPRATAAACATPWRSSRPWPPPCLWCPTTSGTSTWTWPTRRPRGGAGTPGTTTPACATRVGPWGWAAGKRSWPSFSARRASCGGARRATTPTRRRWWRPTAAASRRCPAEAWARRATSATWTAPTRACATTPRARARAFRGTGATTAGCGRGTR